VKKSVYHDICTSVCFPINKYLLFISPHLELSDLSWFALYFYSTSPTRIVTGAGNKRWSSFYIYYLLISNGFVWSMEAPHICRLHINNARTWNQFMGNVRRTSNSEGNLSLRYMAMFDQGHAEYPAFSVGNKIISRYRRTHGPHTYADCYIARRQPIRTVVYPRILNRQRWAARQVAYL
jgi:hypothetical protein